MFQKGFTHADTSIGTAEFIDYPLLVRIFFCTPDTHTAARSGKFNRIIRNIGQQSLHIDWIPCQIHMADITLFPVNNIFHILFCRLLLLAEVNPVQQFCQIKRNLLFHYTSRLQFVHIQNIIHDRDQILR